MISILRYKDKEIKHLDLKYELNRYHDLQIVDNDIILTSNKLIGFDTKTLTFTVLEELEEGFYIAIGRREKVLVDKHGKCFLYNLRTKESILTILNVDYDIHYIGNDYILSNDKLYKFDGADIILIELDITWIITSISSTLYYDDKSLYKVNDLQNFQEDKDIIRATEYRTKIFAVPLTSGQVESVFKRYRKLIPGINKNIKSLILRFCMG